MLVVPEVPAKPADQEIGYALIQVFDTSNELIIGYSPIGFVWCGHLACCISKLPWKMGKEMGNVGCMCVLQLDGVGVFHAKVCGN